LDHPLIILADQALRNRGDGALLTKDETRILSWSEDKTLRVWDVATGQEIGPAMKHDDSVYGGLLRGPRRFRCRCSTTDLLYRFFSVMPPAACGAVTMQRHAFRGLTMIQCNSVTTVTPSHL
jgi:hypothetical protein